MAQPYFLFGVPHQTSSFHLEVEKHIERLKSPIAMIVGKVSSRQFWAHVTRHRNNSPLNNLQHTISVDLYLMFKVLLTKILDPWVMGANIYH